MDIKTVNSDLINFFAVAVVFLIGVAIAFKIFCKKFKFNSKNIELYGLLLNLNKGEKNNELHYRSRNQV